MPVSSVEQNLHLVICQCSVPIHCLTYFLIRNYLHMQRHVLHLLSLHLRSEAKLPFPQVTTLVSHHFTKFRCYLLNRLVNSLIRFQIMIRKCFNNVNQDLAGCLAIRQFEALINKINPIRVGVWGGICKTSKVPKWCFVTYAWDNVFAEAGMWESNCKHVYAHNLLHQSGLKDCQILTRK